MKNFLQNIPKEFMKIWILIDYLVLIFLFGLLVFSIINQYDISSLSIIITSWIAEIGLSTAAYAWKAKNENCCVNFFKRMLESIPEDKREEININDIVLAIINMPKS